jgi:hypothetical protein
VPLSSNVARAAAVPAYQGGSIAIPTPSDTAIETTFQAGHGYTAASGSTGSEADDTQTYVVGTQSLKLTTPGDTGFQAARKTGATLLDATGCHLALTVMVDHPERLTSLRLDVSSDAFTNWSMGDTISPSTNVGAPWYVPSQWVTVVIPWGSYTVGGGAGATRSALTGFQVRASDDGTGPVNVRVNKIATVAASPRAAVTFGFDDGWIGQYTNAFPIMQALWFTGSFAPVVESCTTGNPSYMTPANMIALKAAGWEPCVHAYSAAVHTGYPTDSDAVVIADMFQALAWMRDNDLGPADNFIIPEGAITSNERAVTWASVFTFARSAYTRVRETWPPARRIGLRTYTLSQAHSTSDVAAKVDEAKANGEWLVFEAHNIVDSNPQQIDYLTADFQTVCSYISSVGLPVKTFAQVALSGLV